MKLLAGRQFRSLNFHCQAGQVRHLVDTEWVLGQLRQFQHTLAPVLPDEAGWCLRVLVDPCRSRQAL